MGIYILLWVNLGRNKDRIIVFRKFRKYKINCALQIWEIWIRFILNQSFPKLEMKVLGQYPC